MGSNNKVKYTNKQELMCLTVLFKVKVETQYDLKAAVKQNVVKTSA